MQSRFEPCLMVLHHEVRLRGVIGLSVGALVYGGDTLFEQRCNLLHEKYPFGRWNACSGRYCGKDIHQEPDEAIVVGRR